MGLAAGKFIKPLINECISGIQWPYNLVLSNHIASMMGLDAEEYITIQMNEWYHVALLDVVKHGL